MALIDHDYQIESMVISDRWWMPGSTSLKAQDCWLQEAKAQGCVKHAIYY